MKIKTDHELFPQNAQKLEILTYPEPILKEVAKEVTEFNKELENLCQNMLYTMYHAPGIGLAAPQVGIGKRIFVLDVDYKRKEIDEELDYYEISELNPYIFINPTLKNLDGETVYQEGCLSLPEIYEDVKRFETLEIEYFNPKGEKLTINASGLLSICIQHENDHLNGVVFIEKLSRLKFNFFRNKLIKYKKNYA